jgi:hypothetical protein
MTSQPISDKFYSSIHYIFSNDFENYCPDLGIFCTALAVLLEVAIA